MILILVFVVIVRNLLNLVNMLKIVNLAILVNLVNQTNLVNLVIFVILENLVILMNLVILEKVEGVDTHYTGSDMSQNSEGIHYILTLTLKHHIALQ